jgi:tripartite-type tricarboxylate transporter receptor subunit TctC
VKYARAITRIDGLCKTCQNKRLKEKGKTEEDMKNYIEEAAAKAEELVQDGEE